MTKRSGKKKNIYEEITGRIIEALEEGVIPWAKPWYAAQYGVHRNALTNRPYRGLNILLLNQIAMAEGFIDPRWITFRGSEKLGGHVKKNEKGVQIIFWKFLPITKQEADICKPQEDVDEKNNSKQNVFPFARPYTIFNVEQCEELDISALTHSEILEPVNKEAEKILTLPNIKHGGDKASYFLGEDVITLPFRETFENLNFYYTTAYHEISHWTGNSSRLNRTFGNRFGDHNYAFEELVAEIGAAFLGAHTSIPFEEMRHPEYVNFWLDIFKKDNRAIFTAAAKAQTSADFVLDRAGIVDIDQESLPEAA